MPLFLNSVHVAGNLTSDVEYKDFGDGKGVANFGLAINKRYRGSDGEMKESTVFVQVEAWGKQAELCHKYLSKGRNVMLESELKLDQWTTDDGQKRSMIKLSAQRVHFIGGKSEEDPAEKQESIPATSNSASSMGDDDEDSPPF